MNKIITQEEIENAAKKYAAEVDKNIRDLYGNIPAAITFGECAAESFREGVKFALGEQEKDEVKPTKSGRFEPTPAEPKEINRKYYFVSYLGNAGLNNVRYGSAIISNNKSLSLSELTKLVQKDSEHVAILNVQFLTKEQYEELNAV